MLNGVNQVVRLFREPVLGAIDYWRHPDLRQSWGGPFNGQEVRAAMFVSLIEKIRPCAIIETGTFRGTTTAFLAQAQLPVFTVESNPRNYGFSRAHLRRHHGVSLYRGDSRKVLPRLFRGPLRRVAHRPILVYLDAHAKTDLPLFDEIDLVFRHCPSAVVVVDDFQVPFDDGYAYNDYGPGKALNSSYIEPVVRAHGLTALYPSVPASSETGMRRGCVVLVKQPAQVGVLASMPQLRAVD
jgi:predicted O-methyltransferase YrrM